jgi:hypothetical protein
VAQRLALRALPSCRTAVLGGHVDECDHCGQRRPAFNSCRNRHCPKCQAAARGQWLEARRAELLPVDYFHVVFTLPAAIAEVALQNKALLYDMLFHTSAETMREIAADPKHLGAEIGFLSVLHTWGQNLMHHPHVHCVVPGGGLAPDGERWIACRKNFFLPVRVLSRVFRGKFLEQLRRAYDRGQLSFHGRLAKYRGAAVFRRLVREAYAQEWVVYAKPPFGGPEQVLKYLARYTHRVAISNQRLRSMDGDRVSFEWKDYAQGQVRRIMTLTAIEFIRRFLLHILPAHFVRIRQYGFLTNCQRQAKLQVCRRLLDVARVPEATPVCQAKVKPDPSGDEPAERCQSCGVGRLRTVETRPRPTTQQIFQSWPFDSS